MSSRGNHSPHAAPLLLRIGTGAAFLIWGLGHLLLSVEGEERFGLFRVVGQLGLEPVETWVKVLAGVEALLGFFLLIGLWTRISVWPLVALILFTMAGGQWGHVLRHPHATLDQFVYLAVLLGIFFCGSGVFSADRVLARRKARKIKEEA